MGKVNKTKVSAIQCLNCLDIIYSRTLHDMRYCSCQKVAIDGGDSYIKLSYDSKFGEPIVFAIFVSASKQELYNDWNAGKDKFGKIKV